MSGPHADQPVNLTDVDECVLQATVALHANRAPDGLCRYCGVADCQPGRRAAVVLRSAGVAVLEEWAVDDGYAVGPSES